VQLIEGGEIGELRMMKLDWGFNAGPTPGSTYYYRRDLAGGAILDNGCYTVCMARHLAGAMIGQSGRDPDKLFGTGTLHPEEGIDLDAQALLWWEGGTSAAISANFRTDIDKTVLLTGSEGFIRLPAPYLPLRPDRFGGDPVIVVERQGTAPREIRIDVTDNAYTIESDRVVAYVREGRTEAPEYPWDDMLGNVRTLDRWRKAVGVHLPMDDDTAAGRPS
jgi:predicted dehydrogenase